MKIMHPKWRAFGKVTKLLLPLCFNHAFELNYNQVVSVK